MNTGCGYVEGEEKVTKGTEFAAGFNITTLQSGLKVEHDVIYYENFSSDLSCVDLIWK